MFHEPDDQWSSAPGDYSQLFDQYYGFIKKQAVKKGIQSQHVDDVASEILLRIYETDVIAQFDGSRTFDTARRGVVPARFKSFLAAKVELYLRGKKERLDKHLGREVAIVDMTVNADGHTWMEVFGETWEDDLSAPEMTEMKDEIRYRLVLRGERIDRPLAEMWDAVVDQYSDSGRPNRAELREQFNLPAAAVAQCLREIREVTLSVVLRAAVA